MPWSCASFSVLLSFWKQLSCIVQVRVINHLEDVAYASTSNVLHCLHVADVNVLIFVIWIFPTNWIMLSSINHDNMFISYYICWIRMFPLWLLDMHRFQCVHSLLSLTCRCHDHKERKFKMESTSAKIIKM